MSVTSGQLNSTSTESGVGDVRDFIALLKPRVMVLSIFTAAVGIFLAPATLHPVLVVASILFIAVGAGASGALNMWYDADIDVLMTRTAKRPIPSGKVNREDALILGTMLSVMSVVCLWLITNVVAAGLLAFTILFYLVVYTIGLKRRTPQNIVIGGAAGALPPMVGWAAVTGNISLESITLFTFIFLWTPPHFWALAMYRNADYSAAKVPMLPVVKGKRHTQNQIWVYSWLMVISSLVPYALGMSSVLFAVVSAGMGIVFLIKAWRVYVAEDTDLNRHCRALFGYSIGYLFFIFAALLADRLAVHFIGFIG